jgi:SpoVK/Ycf46/Vps4 family AAA+-type ATPase
MMDGPPGTGKTQASKYIARIFEVPLYRVDVGGVKNKYVGESERRMLETFNRVDQEEPCVILFDEIEKVFTSTHGENDAGTTTTMLSQMLWWLQEHRSRVFTVMTTNALKKIPKELWRPGRIDQVMWFGGLETGDALQLATKIAETFPNVPITQDDLKKMVDFSMSHHAVPNSNPSTVSHATITEGVYRIVKRKQAAKGAVKLVSK